jgi:type III secretion protein K
MACAPGAAHAAWLTHPQADSLLRFDWLPSLWLHPTRVAALLPASAGTLLQAAPNGSRAHARLHEHWSRGLLGTLGLGSLDDPHEASLCLAALPEPAWMRLAQYGGATLAAPRLRRVIAREQLAVLGEALGTQTLEFACGRAAHLHPGLDAANGLPSQDLAASCLAWGRALVARALEAAPRPVARRGQLRLSQDAVETAPLALAGIDAPQALVLCMSLIEEIEPSWHSSFRAAR